MCDNNSPLKKSIKTDVSAGVRQLPCCVHTYSLRIASKQLVPQRRHLFYAELQQVSAWLSSKPVHLRPPQRRSHIWYRRWLVPSALRATRTHQSCMRKSVGKATLRHTHTHARRAHARTFAALIQSGSSRLLTHTGATGSAARKNPMRKYGRKLIPAAHNIDRAQRSKQCSRSVSPPNPMRVFVSDCELTQRPNLSQNCSSPIGAQGANMTGPKRAQDAGLRHLVVTRMIEWGSTRARKACWVTAQPSQPFELAGAKSPNANQDSWIYLSD